MSCKEGSVGNHVSDLAFGIFDHLDLGDRRLNDLYEMRLQLAEAYDQWGFYSYHVAEHHFTPLGSAPSPAVFLAALSQRTKRLRFGPMVYLFPFYHPLRLAEEICMLDQLSNGRLDVGLGRGISPLESRLFGNDPELSQRSLDESRAIILMALSEGRVDYHGEAFNFEGVTMTLTPFQKPHPPLWYGATTVATAERCARSGYNIINNDVGEGAREVASRYAAECGRIGNTSFRSGLRRFIVVADSDSEAFEIGSAAYPSWYDSFMHLWRKHGGGPVMGERATEFGPNVESGLAITGSPETVTRVLREQVRESGINYVVGQFAFGDMPTAAALRSIELFGSQVMPALV
jgi:alkanesulfonate monooxygenase SsuD/methylene tetrahydromethanopterin reductase-like flavin-dependent oxidoreductase (luciferase family)